MEYEYIGLVGLEINGIMEPVPLVIKKEGILYLSGENWNPSTN